MEFHNFSKIDKLETYFCHIRDPNNPITKYLRWPICRNTTVSKKRIIKTKVSRK